MVSERCTVCVVVVAIPISIAMLIVLLLTLHSIFVVLLPFYYKY